MKLDEVGDVLLEITYKPDISIVCTLPHDMRAYKVKLTREVPDADNPGQSTVIISTLFLSEEVARGMKTKMDVVRWVENHIQRFERHEFEEWFRVDGERVYNPHPEVCKPGGL